jgi:hypothetical protein
LRRRRIRGAEINQQNACLAKRPVLIGGLGSDQVGIVPMKR